MALTASNVRTGVSGEVLVAPTTATFPTTAAAATTGFTGLGYLGPDGVGVENERSTTNLVAWQNNAVVRTVTTDAGRTYTFTLWETTKATIEFAYGTTVTQTATEGSYTITPGATGGRRKFIVDVIDGAFAHREMFEGELSALSEAGWRNGEAVGFECTVTAYGDITVKDTALKTP
jgi:hypothetical protein